MGFKHSFITLILSGVLVSAQDTSEPGFQLSLAVISDPHFYDPGPGTAGKPFEALLNSHGKLIRESQELMETAMNKILLSNAGIALIPGDLTKDGAVESHLGMAGQLEKLEERGIKVFVVPGNHDVNNSRSDAYKGKGAGRVPHVDPATFTEIYGPYGYDEAIFKDSGSLSYIAEPVEGFWVIGLDACQYARNDSLGNPETGGAMGKEQRRWLESILQTNEASTKTKVVLMHHGILEHYQTQAKHFGDYVVDDYKRRARWLASLGIKTVFTGHYHANDITFHQWKDGSFLFDIETGSLVTYPCPVRFILIRGDSMMIRTEHILTIPSMEIGLQNYARKSVSQGAADVAAQKMLRWKLNPEDANYIALQLGTLFSEHCMGDEIARNPAISLDGVSLWGRIMILFRKRFVTGLANDLPPSDNQLTIDLNTGKYY